MVSEKDSVQDVAHLACIHMEPGEEKLYQTQFNKILNHFTKLENVETTGVVPMVTPHEMNNTLRQDHVEKDITLEELLDNAPDVKDSLFKVPPVV